MAIGALTADSDPATEPFPLDQAYDDAGEVENDLPEEANEQDPVDRLTEILQAQNVAELLTEEQLAAISDRCLRMFEIDLASYEEDKAGRPDEIMDLARQVAHDKTYPWPNAANIIYPLISEAAIQFNARAYPAIVDGKAVVKAKVMGPDPQGVKQARGDRVARYMSYQLIEEEDEWEGDTDRLLIMIPIVGDMYRKVWFDKELGRNRSEILGPDQLIVNQSVKSFSRAPRATQLCEYYPHEIQEMISSGKWLKFDYETNAEGGDDEDAPHKFIEQWCRIDLDEDGYSEPYAVTIHRESQKVAHIMPCFRPEGVMMKRDGSGVERIKAEAYYIHYQFMPDPKGGYHGIGLGRLLFSTNKTINGLLNLLMDTGHLAALGGGFIGNGASPGAGRITFNPGEWKKIDVTGAALRDNIVPLPVRDPSPVLFNLLGLLVESGKSLAATKDILTGEAAQTMTASLGLALIEQGMKVFTACYKRIHRALHDELRLRYHLNNLYLNPETYFNFQDSGEGEQVGPQDFTEGDLDVVPVTDPTVVTDMQRMARAQYLAQYNGNPLVNQAESLRRQFEAAGFENVDKLLAQGPPPEDPRVKVEALKGASEIERNRAETAKIWKELGLMDTEALLNIAKAEAAETGSQINQYESIWDRIVTINQALEQEKINADAGTDHAGGTEGVAPPPDNPEGMDVPQ